MRGRDVMLEVLATERVVHVFGNPGTTELPFIDALATDSRFEYVLVLHEGIAIGMADGYAQVTRRPAFVNLHTAPGLGNAMGVLTNVRVTGTPMVVTAGQQHRGHLFAEPFLSGNLEDMARPLTKWSFEVRDLRDLGPALRRAFHEAEHPPSGPVFVSIPMDVLDEDGDIQVPIPSRIERRTVPADLGELTRALLAVRTGRLAIVAGDEVAVSNGVQALVDVAERLAARVFGTPMHSNTVFPTTHPLWAGPLPADAESLREVLSSFDTVFLIGRRGFLTFLYRPTLPVPPGLELIHLSPSASDLGRVYPTRLGVVGDPSATLSALAETLPSHPEGADGALDVSPTRPQSAGEMLDEPGRTRMHPTEAIQALIGVLPPDIAVVDEAVINDPLIRSALPLAEPDRFFYSRGGGLGWGMAAALGVSLGRGREPVACFVGDGSALFGIHALWTAARLQLPVVMAVLNNRGYLILRRFLRDLGGPGAAAGRFVGVDIDGPAVDFVSIANGFGVEAVQVERVGDVAEAMKSALAAGAPRLLDLQIGSVL